MMEWLFLLLPVAAASGWWLARRTPRYAGAQNEREPVFFRGFNHLLNEQPDKAIDAFLELAEVDSETVETHLALGALFRRRGEVDRAIRIHQNLVARPSLGDAQRGFALYELGRDYMLAGLFDRAESLFRELVERQVLQRRALRALIEIYQAEKEWLKCLETAEALERVSDVSLRTEIAQYHCELAEQCLRDDKPDRARSHLLDAQCVDADCIRASLVQARMELNAGDAETAAVLYHRVAQRGPRYLPALLPEFVACWQRLGRTSITAQLQALFEQHPSPPLMLRLCDAIEAERGGNAAREFLVGYLGRRADLSGVGRLLALRRQAQPAGSTEDGVMLAVIARKLAASPDYQCDHCGFEARELHWQCPSCKCWGSIKAVEPEPIGEPAVLRQRQTA
nr:lipopolysaccharide assembly protein LapB [uncultured Thiohalocapsa sp.]